MVYAASYTAEPTRPSGGPLPGAVRLLRFCVDEFDAVNLGIYNPRDICGNQWPDWKCPGSQHARGAAGDAGFPVVRPGGHPNGNRLAGWLVAHHLDLGVQEVIWAGRRWTNQERTWKTYTGRSDHFDHVHWALNNVAAQNLTDEQIADAYAPPADEETDMLIITCSGKPTRLLAPPTCAVIDGATVTNLKNAGVKAVVYEADDYDALLKHVEGALGR